MMAPWPEVQEEIKLDVTTKLVILNSEYILYFKGGAIVLQNERRFSVPAQEHLYDKNRSVLCI